MSLDFGHGAWKRDEEIIEELLEIRSRYAKWGVLRILARPLVRRELRQWSVTNALLIPATLPVMKLYWGPPWGKYPPEETPSPVPRWSIAMLHVLAMAYADQVIVGDLQFRDLLKDLDPRGHRFCRMGEVMESLATPGNPLEGVHAACNRVFDYVRDVPFSDGNMDNLATLVRGIVMLTEAKHKRSLGNLAKIATAVAQETVESFHMSEITEKIQAAVEIKKLTQEQDGDELVGLKVHELRVQEFRETIQWLGIREELRQWIVC